MTSEKSSKSLKPPTRIPLIPPKSPFSFTLKNHHEFPMANFPWPPYGHDQENAGVLISMDELGFTHFM